MNCIICGSSFASTQKKCSMCEADTMLSKAGFVFEFTLSDYKVIEKHYAIYENKKREAEKAEAERKKAQQRPTSTTAKPVSDTANNRSKTNAGSYTPPVKTPAVGENREGGKIQNTPYWYMAEAESPKSQ